MKKPVQPTFAFIYQHPEKSDEFLARVLHLFLNGNDNLMAVSWQQFSGSDTAVAQHQLYELGVEFITFMFMF